jgi:protein-tyrosine phosphatase
MNPDHPITPIALYNGQLGLCACPGGRQAFLGRPNPDSGIDALAQWPATAVITLMESRELEMLGLSEVPEKLQARIPLWLHLPISDVNPPGHAWLQRWRLARLLIAALLAEGGKVAIHCLAGVGRTGTVASLCLIDAGKAHGRAAIEQVRQIHHVRAAETPEQEAFVERYEPESILSSDCVHDQLADFVAEAGVDSVLDEDGRLDRARAGRLMLVWQ